MAADLTPRRLAGFSLFLLLAAVVWFGRPGPPIEVTIPPGLSGKQTARLLEEKGVVRLAIVFRLAAKITGADRKLKPGTYRLHEGMAVRSVLKALTEGLNNDVKVVIPEGFSVKQIGDRLQAAGVCKAQDFVLHAAQNRFEGYLFPTTYQFTPETSAEKVVVRMRQEFTKQITPLYENARPKPELTLHQVLTLASIVEREAVLAREKPVIAAVYFNRMKKRMRLEADPTVQYALGYWKKGLTLKDLQDPSPYNTYTHYGLPPGPICNPGVEAVKGVLAPAQSEAIFFVADNTGGHVFTNTAAEHLKAKQAFKSKRRVINREIRRQERESKK